MASITTTASTLEVTLTGLDGVWALRRRLVVPLDAVVGATADPGAAREPKGLRAPGLHVPGAAAVGTFHREGEKTLWAVHRGDRAVVVQPRGGPQTSGYDRVVVEVSDPRAAVDAVTRAVTAR